MNYTESINYLYSRLPMFSRSGASAIKTGLGNTSMLCDILGNPQHKFKSVHIAGTNGKGSTSHMIAAILQKAGYKTGLYTSPHLRDFRERIRINGEMIPEEEVVKFVEGQKNNIEKIEPSFFEVTVALAFNYFAEQKVDIAVIEVGLGGRLDSTNIITPLLSIITNIGYDHMNVLGNTLPAIAAEKAGIIKPHIPVIIGERQPEVEQVFIAKAEENHAPISFAADEWEIQQWKIEEAKDEKEPPGRRFLNIQIKPLISNSSALSLRLDLTGSYQLKNLPGVLSAVFKLNERGFSITDQQITEALSQVKSLTGLMGRWQQLSSNPLIICDTGHNEDGIREVVKNIESTPYHRLHIVIGMVKDKDIRTVLSLLPKQATYYFCKPNVERGKNAEELAQEAFEWGLKGASFPSVKAAIEAAKTHAEQDDLIFIGGSTFVVAEAI